MCCILFYLVQLIYLVAGYDGTGYNDIIYYDNINEIIGYAGYTINMAKIMNFQFYLQYHMSS